VEKGHNYISFLDNLILEQIHKGVVFFLDDITIKEDLNILIIDLHSMLLCCSLSIDVLDDQRKNTV